MTLDFEEMKRMILRDPTIPEEKKTSLLLKLMDQKAREHLVPRFSPIDHALVRFAQLNKTTQIILSLLGFGVVRSLLTKSQQKEDQFLTHLPNQNAYQINPWNTKK